MLSLSPGNVNTYIIILVPRESVRKGTETAKLLLILSTFLSSQELLLSFFFLLLVTFMDLSERHSD